MQFATRWVAVLDANVLYPPLLRDVLVGLATANLYDAIWSDEILAEVERNLLRQLGPEKTARNITALYDALPDARISGYEAELQALSNHPKDRHVAAVAVHSRANIIVTGNLRDFEPLPKGIKALTPDEFLQLFLQYHEVCWQCLEDICEKWPTPPDVNYLLQRLSKFAPEFIIQMRNARK